jgi:3-oxoacyl-[acyl-carrier protein] reductase
VRSVQLHVARLDDLPGELNVQAERLSGDDNNILYQFRSATPAAACWKAGAARRARRNNGRPQGNSLMKRALVTGGSGGIGAAICRRLAADGHHVIVHANRSLDKAAAVVAEIISAGGSAEAVAFDVTDRTASEAALEPLLENGAIQILVNNAGIHADAVFPGMSAEQWHSVIDVSLNGFFNVTQPLTMPMIRTRWGRIITISSVAGITGNRGQVNYAAAKGALHAASKSLALELASRGITVNAVAPGIIATEMSEGAFDADAIKQIVPMQRAGKPEEVADLVAFLASENAAYISGR